MQQECIDQIITLIDKGGRPCTDSRKANKGDVFFALRGERFDANQYAEEALKAGCALAVVDDPRVATGSRYILADNVLDALQKISHYHRKRFNIPLIGITGSNGKTTTKELMHAVLATTLQTGATEGNLNNHIGVPLTLLSFPEHLDIAIVEMGANHVGEIDDLCQIAMPTHGLITNIGKAHLEGFGDIDSVARAKGELYQYINRQHAPPGTLFVNKDDTRLSEMTREAGYIGYGSGSDNHCAGTITKTHPCLAVRFKTNKDFGKALRGVEGHIQSQLTGKYNFGNIMAAVTAGLYFGVQPARICDAIASYTPGNHRSQIINTRFNMVLMDAYNANPTSMNVALDNFSRFEGNKKAVMLGDMLELGTEAEAEHRQIVAMVKKRGFSLNMFVGSHFMSICKPEKNILVFPDTVSASRWLSENPLRGYKILVKGSRGIRMEDLLPHL